MPLIGRVIGQGGAYGYLVRSVRDYPDPARIGAIMRDAGLEDIRWTPMTMGMVTIHVGTVPGAPTTSAKTSTAAAATPTTESNATVG